jgi:lipoate-protein ligase A
LSASGHHPIQDARDHLSPKWRKVFAKLGLSVEIADAVSIAEYNKAARAARLDGACFAGLSHGELLDGQGRKLLGLAQRRGRWGILLSSGLLLAETPWEILEFVRHGQRPERSGMHQLASAGLASLAPALTEDKLCRSLLDDLQLDLDGTHPVEKVGSETTFRADPARGSSMSMESRL